MVVAIAATAGCAGSDDGGGAGTTLRWFAQIQPGGTIEEVAKRCSEESNGRYNVELELLPTLSDQAREQLVRRLGAEDSTDRHHRHGRDLDGGVRQRRLAAPYEGELERQVTEDVFDSVLETASFEGKLYGAPFNSNTQLLWYRTDQVEQPPTTWDEMISEAERARARRSRCRQTATRASRSGSTT